MAQLSSLKGANFAYATHVVPSVDIKIIGNAKDESVYNELCSQFAEKGLTVSHGSLTDDNKLSLYFDGQDPHKVMQAVADMWRATR
ncbi:MAG: hypothetical protein C0436_02885 [Alphaproteobacteria bacterium]|nr:hypothetical protein [Alphaproteobacteria bacterium]